jgi:hypothetical protein
MPPARGAHDERIQKLRKRLVQLARVILGLEITLLVATLNLFLIVTYLLNNPLK